MGNQLFRFLAPSKSRLYDDGVLHVALDVQSVPGASPDVAMPMTLLSILACHIPPFGDRSHSYKPFEGILSITSDDPEHKLSIESLAQNIPLSQALSWS